MCRSTFDGLPKLQSSNERRNCQSARHKYPRIFSTGATPKLPKSQESVSATMAVQGQRMSDKKEKRSQAPNSSSHPPSIINTTQVVKVNEMK